jgi:hypothetical protein
MKNLLLFVLSFLCYISSSAQTDVNKTADNPYKYSQFFSLSQARYVKDVNHSLDLLQKESIKIQQLDHLDDSLLAKGDISDSISKLYKNKLQGYKSENDSLLKLGAAYKTQLSSLSVVKKKFRIIVNTVPQFCNTIVNKAVDRNFKLTNVEEELGRSNLGAEKKQLKAILGNAATVQKVDVKKVDAIGNTKGDVLKTGNIDSATATNVDTRIAKYLKRIEDNANEIKLLEKRIGTPEDYAANGASIKSRVLVIDSVVNKSAKSRQFTFDLIEEGLKKSTRTLFSLAAFFGPGGYAIPEEKSDKALKYFSPVIDSLVKFSNKFGEIPRTATILVNGYADATQIGKGSKLYNDLGAYLKVENPSKEQLNIGLSALRAEELSNLFTKSIKLKSTEFVALPQITFENIEVGRGEQLPDATIKNYKVNDERRRIVVVYWSVLPND